LGLSQQAEVEKPNRLEKELESEKF